MRDEECVHGRGSDEVEACRGEASTVDGEFFSGRTFFLYRPVGSEQSRVAKPEYLECMRCNPLDQKHTT